MVGGRMRFRCRWTALRSSPPWSFCIIAAPAALRALPWVALTAGTFASLAANVAVGGSDLIGRAVAGWPALALLVAIKLLAGLVDTSDRGGSCGRDHAVDSPPVGDQRLDK